MKIDLKNDDDVARVLSLVLELEGSATARVCGDIVEQFKLQDTTNVDDSELVELACVEVSRRFSAEAAASATSACTYPIQFEHD